MSIYETDHVSTLVPSLSMQQHIEVRRANRSRMYAKSVPDDADMSV